MRPAALPDDWRIGYPHLPEVLGFAMNHASQVDDYDDHGLVVLHDVPAWVDPTRPVSAGGTGLRLLSRDPSGASMYGGSSPFFGADIVVLPPTTWTVVVDPAVATRLVLAYRRRESVPYLPLHARAALESFNTPGPRTQLEPWLPNASSVVGFGTIAYPAAPGALAPLVERFTYPDGYMADRAVTELRGLWRDGALARAAQRKDEMFIISHLAGIQSEGSSVLVQSYVEAKSVREYYGFE